MVYSQAKVIAGGLAHIPIVIGVFYFIMTFFNKRAIEYAEANKPKKVEKKVEKPELKEKIVAPTKIEAKVEVEKTTSDSSEIKTESPKNDEITNWKLSPLLYSDFYGLPITYIYGAGLDPLVDEGYALMKRLKSFENEVYYKVYEGQMHAFVSNIVSLPTSIDCINEASRAIKKIIQIN